MISGQNLKQPRTPAFISFCAASLRFPEAKTILLPSGIDYYTRILSQSMQDRTNTVLQTMAIWYIKLIAWVIGNVLLIIHIAPLDSNANAFHLTKAKSWHNTLENPALSKLKELRT
jgi:hypothetical protein